MTTGDKISQHINQLPEAFQEEVLDFVEFLIERTKRGNSRKEDLEWFASSLNSAIRDIDDEEGPTYHESDLKEKWN